MTTKHSPLSALKAQADKIITIDMPWATIRATSEAGISEYIVRQMREARDVGN